MRATYETWQRRNGIASWTFSLPLLPGENPAEGLPRCFARVVSSLDGFARVHDVDVATVEHGEEPTSITGAAINVHGVGIVFNRPEHVAKLGVSLDLLVALKTGGAETAIEQAGLLEVEIDEHTVEDRTIGLRLSIDIDIYSPMTWGEHRENRALAELNAPRLAKFLAIVRRDLSGSCDAVDAEGYPGLVDETGFRVG